MQCCDSRASCHMNKKSHGAQAARNSTRMVEEWRAQTGDCLSTQFVQAGGPEWKEDECVFQYPLANVKQKDWPEMRLRRHV